MGLSLRAASAGGGRLLVNPDRAIDSHAHADFDRRDLHGWPADDELQCQSIDDHDRRHIHSHLDSAVRVRQPGPNWSEPVCRAPAVKRKLSGSVKLARLSDRDWDRQLRGQERRHGHTDPHHNNCESEGNADASGKPRTDAQRWNIREHVPPAESHATVHRDLHGERE